jgi:hypothetical protein
MRIRLTNILLAFTMLNGCTEKPIVISTDTTGTTGSSTTGTADANTPATTTTGTATTGATTTGTTTTGTTTTGTATTGTATTGTATTGTATTGTTTTGTTTTGTATTGTTTTGTTVGGKTCATSAEISAHLAIVAAPLGGGATAGSDDSRFCIHTIVDGTKRLLNSDPITDVTLRPANGLMVAFADVNYQDNGVDFSGVEKECASLTVGGTSAGSWHALVAKYPQALPRTDITGRSAEALVKYFQDSTMPPIGFWTISASIFGGAEAGGVAYMDLAKGLPINGFIDFTAIHFNHLEIGLGVMCLMN